MTAGSRVIAVDETTGVVTAGAAVTIDALIRFLVPRRLFVPVTPGTRYVTVGGAVAADIHGKNHRGDGSWMDYTVALTLITPDGAVRSIDRQVDAEAFWATGGGLGLTGVITSCSFRALPIESGDAGRHDAAARSRRGAGRDVVDVGSALPVAWIDVHATGAALGRGRADRSRPRVAGRCRRAPVRVRRRSSALPLTLPVVNRWTIAATAEGRWWRAPGRRRDEVQTISGFVHPLDAVDGWNRLYGRRGFVQWQCVVPLGGEETLPTIVGTLARERVPSFLAVLKRMGRPIRDRCRSRWPAGRWPSMFLRRPVGCGDAPSPRPLGGGSAAAHLPRQRRCRPPDLIPLMYPRSRGMAGGAPTGSTRPACCSPISDGASGCWPAARRRRREGRASATCSRCSCSAAAATSPTPLCAVSWPGGVARSCWRAPVPTPSVRWPMSRARRRDDGGPGRLRRRSHRRPSRRDRGGVRASWRHRLGDPGVRRARRRRRNPRRRRCARCGGAPTTSAPCRPASSSRGSCSARATGRWWCCRRWPGSGRARASFVYGSTKAGLDAFAEGLGDALCSAPDGIHVVVVRPGFVTTKMTAGRPPAPMATTVDAVADAVVAAIQSGRDVVWGPPALRYAFAVLRHVPAWAVAPPVGPPLMRTDACELCHTTEIADQIAEGGRVRRCNATSSAPISSRARWSR